MTMVGIPDLSAVTDELIKGLKAAVTNSAIWATTTRYTIMVSGMAFDLAREEGDVQVALSLVHVGPNPSLRNLTQRGASGLTTITSPTALTLTYALSAFGAQNYAHEQQAMSIALAWLLANPYLRFAVGTPPRPIECAITLEAAGFEEIGRLWQSFGGPLRLTALFRVSALFLGPEPPTATPAPRPTQLGMLVGPAEGTGPRLLFAMDRALIDSGASQPPPGPGDVLLVGGLGLDGTDRLFLSPDDDGSSFDVTGWIDDRTANVMRVALPAASGAPPTGTPPAGHYRLRIGAATGPAIMLEIGA